MIINYITFIENYKIYICLSLLNYEWWKANSCSKRI